MLLAGKAAISASPAQRWPENESTGYCRHAAFIADAYRFDPGFFSIAPVQALFMDPQERRLLQTAYHALEASGYFEHPHAEVGVYTAAMYAHYQQLDDGNPAFSTSFAQIANRISHRLDLRGPSLCVDTMCSGSLVALHLAIGALRNEECRIALVGAANIHVRAGKFRLLCEGGYLSRSGRCHTFGAAADGYLAGEGSIAVVLKRFADAYQDNDPILGVIRASAVGASGDGQPFTVPSARAQHDVIRRALAASGLTPEHIGYIECHGTGTPVGDPVEIASLGQAYGEHRRTALPIGSIKANIGHLEAAAGLAGLIKVLLQMRHGTLLPSTGHHPLNPKLDLAAARLSICSDAQSWNGTRIAGINAFGAGGTNAHVIVQAPPTRPPAARIQRPMCAVPLSAHTQDALRVRIGALRDWCDQHVGADLYAVGCTLARAREHHRYRICLLATDLPMLRSGLAHALEGSFHDTDDKEHNREHDKGMQTREHALLPDDCAKNYLRGAPCHWDKFYPQRVLIDLPSYPFGGRDYNAMRASQEAPPVPAQPPTPVDTPVATAAIASSPTRSCDVISTPLLDWHEHPGDGPLVLLLPPTNLSVRAWHCQTEFLRRRGYRLLLPVYPGHAGHPMPAESLDVCAIADAIVHRLDQIKAGPVHCVGWSLGAVLALQLAIAHANRLRTLCLIGGSARFEGSIAGMLAAFQCELRQWSEFIALQIDAGEENGHSALLAGADGTAMAAYYGLLREHDLRAHLSRIRLRTLILHGARDACVGAHDFSLLSAIPDARAVSLPHVGHLLPITASADVNRLLLEHFA